MSQADGHQIGQIQDMVNFSVTFRVSHGTSYSCFEFSMLQASLGFTTLLLILELLNH